ncbi:MAG: hydantoinase B/oxoprolinase family protein [Methylococcaceae bacterium]
MADFDNNWQFWIDRGGTFTDIVANTPDNQLLTRKLLSDNPEHYADAALQGINDFIAEASNKSIACVKMGTTVGTNALLERKGEATALLITAGFKDCLRIGYQNRPDIFALDIQLPEQLYQTVIEIDERIDAQGQVLKPLDKPKVKQQLELLFASGLRSIAIVLMHAWRYPAHECQLASLAKVIGFSQISISHQVSPFMKIVSRGDTTVVDAYLSPLLKRYVNQVTDGLCAEHVTPPTIMFMQSNGGLTAAQNFQGKDSILSGPAGGIVGAVETAKKAGFNKIIAFDMGGTSTDVAHYAGELERSYQTEVAGIRMRVPMMNIHTVAAGGGSLLFFDGLRYRVGPESAGANPGPAGYRRGGPLTVTDANIMLGKLPLFPAIFGEHGDLSLDKEKVEQLFVQLAAQIKNSCADQRSPQQVAEGFINIAVENMATAIKKISVQKGYNVSEYTLCCYGAAAGQHACKVADRLGITTIMLHPFSGILSAYGMGLADLRLLKDSALEQPWEEASYTQLKDQLLILEQQGRAEMLLQISDLEISSIFRVNLRYFGTDTSLAVLFADKASMLLSFQKQYQQQFGFVFTDKAIIIESLSVEIIGQNSTDQEILTQPSNHHAIPALFTDIFTENRSHKTPVYQRESLTQAVILKGPVIIVEPTATIVIEPGWEGKITAANDLVLTRTQPIKRQLAVGTTADPVMLEIFNKLFMSIAEQMGFVLQKTAYSVNIKERLDFSCALFDNNAQLIANAPHIPVHLGSMGESVLALLNSDQVSIKAEQVYLLNSPYHGGTHLPDITVVTPVFSVDNSRLLFFIASRSHHADVGGISPGSMPADSQHIEQEGVLSMGMIIVKKGVFQEQKVRRWLESSPYPARNPEQNIADLQAQIAANNKGMFELRKMVEQYTLQTVLQYMQHVQNNAAECVRNILPSLTDGQFINTLDNGAKIVVKIQINKALRTATIDFTGSSTQQLSNFNAPAAVCKAAVLYVFRTLVTDDIPLNAGCLQPLNIIIPKNSMLNPQYPAAVVAGNVETSQTIVDALYGALGVLAGSQGTMNNLTFGNDNYQYYETICGGAGAGYGFNGSDAVQTHMTNSRITDPEVLEWRFPVLLEEFSIRQNTGGAGLWKGGNGVRRKIKFLESMSATILSSHRVHAPFGVQHGLAAQVGMNTVIKANGEVITVDACTQVNLHKNDSIQIETPGGGGYGKCQN